jgi:hypothetical protein
MRLAILHHKALCHPLFLHTPGDKLILEGVDSLSRGKTIFFPFSDIFVCLF